MKGTLDFIRFPVPGSVELLIATVVFLGLFVFAFVAEALRRRYLQKQTIKRAWEELTEIVREKDISDVEFQLLQRIIKSCCPQNPLGFVTERRVFNQIVTRYMSSIRSEPARYEQEGVLLRDLRVRLGLDFVPVGQPIDTTRDLHIGQTIFARKRATQNESWVKLVVNRVDEAYLHTTLDIGTEKIGHVLFQPNEELFCKMWREDDARYSFKTSVARVESIDKITNPEAISTGKDMPPLNTVVLYHGESLERTQERAYFRVRHNQPAFIGIVPAPADGNYEGVSLRKAVTQLRGRIVSLSAGGIAIEMPQSLPQHVLLRTNLDMPSMPPLTVTARIVGVSQLGPGRYLVRASFVDISEEARDTIAQYVWRRQQPVAKPEHANL